MTSISDTEVVNAPGGLVELGYVTKTTSTTISNTYAGGGNDMGLSLTVICDGSPILVNFYCPSVALGATAGDGAGVILRMDGTEQAVMGAITGASGQQIGDFTMRLTPSAGSHTFTITGYRIGTNSASFAAANSGAGSYQPMFLRVSKIIQASQLLVTQSNAPIVTSLPVGNLVTGQEIDLYVTTPYAGYQRYKWNGTAWYMVGDSRGAEWQSYSPGIANITLGNGTLQSRYRVYGKTINYIGQLQWGSTTSASGYFVVNLPTNAYNSLIVGSVLMIDGGTRAWTGSCAPWSAGQFYIIHTESGNFGGVNQTNPFTWGNGDYFTWSITYEMA